MEFDKTAYYTRDVVHSVKLFYRLVKIFHHLVKIFHRLVKSILPASLKHSLRSCFKLKPVKYFSLFGKIFSLHGKIFSLHGKIISPLYLHPLYSKQLLRYWFGKKSTFPQTRVNKYHSTLEIGLTILSGINTGSVSNEFADK